jgi:hypothetical protein
MGIRKEKEEMKRIIYILLLLLAVSCKPQHQIIVEHVTQTHYVDSLVIRDSVVTVPVERYVDLVREYDTLKLSTSLASAEAWLDTANSCLKGSIWNKNTYTYEKETIDHYITKDSIVDRPVPYPVVEYVKNPVNKNILWWAISVSIGLIAALVFILRKPIMKLIALIK